MTLLGCGTDLGDCDTQAANELVYSSNGLVATKGQALAHDSCGNGGFCHSKAAKGKQRYGVPATLDFDMLNEPTGLRKMRDLAEDSWELVKSGQMPPSGAGAKVAGNGNWSSDIAGGPAGARLPALSTTQGMAAFRNWLACGAPVVTDTEVPPDARPTRGEFVMAGSVPTWMEVHTQIITPYCATAGCHGAVSPAAGLSLEDLCGADAALRKPGPCGQTPVVPSEVSRSFLLDKIEASAPRCGGAMPPGAPLPAQMRNAIRAWIADGASAGSCL